MTYIVSGGALNSTHSLTREVAAAMIWNALLDSIIHWLIPASTAHFTILVSSVGSILMDRAVMIILELPLSKFKVKLWR